MLVTKFYANALVTDEVTTILDETKEELNKLSELLRKDSTKENEMEVLGTTKYVIEAIYDDGQCQIPVYMGVDEDKITIGFGVTPDPNGKVVEVNQDF